MKTLQAKLIFIDPNREHPESKAGAYMTRLLDSLAEQQKKDVYWLRDRWRSREEATDLDCFQVGKKLQELCQSTPIDFAQAAYEQNKPAPANKGGNPNQRNMCGVAHGGRSSHSWAECFSNPINGKKKPETSQKSVVEPGENLATTTHLCYKLGSRLLKHSTTFTKRKHASPQQLPQ